MSQDKEAGLFTFNHPVVTAFPNLFEAKKVKRAGKETGDAKFSLNLVVFPNHPEYDAFRKHVAKVARAQWADKPFSDLKLPMSDGNKMADKRKAKSGKDDGDFQRGAIVIVARSKYRPSLSALVNGKLVEFTEETLPAAKKYFYFGVEACVQVNCTAYDAIDEDAKPGVTAYLQSVMSTNKGKKLGGGGAPASEVFKGYVGKTVDEDPTGGLDDLDDDIQF